MRVLLISPYHSGSHQSWAEGYIAHSRNSIHLLSLPGRFWKWRMAGSSVTFAHMTEELVKEVGPPDVVIADDMLELDAYLGLTRRSLGDPKVILYMHENQLTYPISGKAAPDISYGFRNWKSMAVADEVWFNSNFHLGEVANALPALLNSFPDHKHSDYQSEVMERARVMPIGVETIPAGTKTSPPLLLWNHRWEYDKNPTALFAALDSLLDLPWRLALCGENFSNSPKEFLDAKNRYGDRVIQFGHAPRERYEALVGEAAIVISTANHEFFGISVVEAVSAGALPLLPTRLSYPELIPSSAHDRCLYGDDQDLAPRLRTLLQNPAAIARDVEQLAASMQRFSWNTMAPRYDDALEDLVNR